MKKLIAILLAGCMLFMLAGCLADEDVRGNITDNSGATNSVAEEQEAKEPEFSMGKTTGKNYENKFLSIGCNLDDNWTFSTDEQIKELNNIASDAMGEDIAKQIENAEIIYDMQATHSNGTDNININLENMGLLGGISDLRTRLDNSIPMIKEALTNIGLSNIVTKNVTVEIDGKEFIGVDIVAEVSGMKFYERIFCMQKGKYMANITLAAFSEEALEQITDCFYIIK